VRTINNQASDMTYKKRERIGETQRKMERQKRILIIDDDADFRNLLRLHLTRAGYKVEIAEDAVVGGRALLERPPDLVLSDVSMPFLTGIELLSLIRSDERAASIPVILLSCHSDDKTVSKAMQSGAADFLTKPVTIEDLLRSIHTCLAKTDRNAAADLRPV
jgi:two-component system response regulator RpaA